jgi:hypothetical protein
MSLSNYTMLPFFNINEYDINYIFQDDFENEYNDHENDFENNLNEYEDYEDKYEIEDNEYIQFENKYRNRYDSWDESSECRAEIRANLEYEYEQDQLYKINCINKIKITIKNWRIKRDKEFFKNINYYLGIFTTKNSDLGNIVLSFL